MNEVELSNELKRAASTEVFGGPPALHELEAAHRQRRRQLVARAAPALALAVVGGWLGVTQVQDYLQDAPTQIPLAQNPESSSGLQCPSPEGAKTGRTLDYFAPPDFTTTSLDVFAIGYLSDGERYESEDVSATAARLYLMRADGTTRAVVEALYNPSFDSWIEESATWCQGEPIDRR